MPAASVSLTVTVSSVCDQVHGRMCGTGATASILPAELLALLEGPRLLLARRREVSEVLRVVVAGGRRLALVALGIGGGRMGLRLRLRLLDARPRRRLGSLTSQSTISSGGDTLLKAMVVTRTEDVAAMSW